jgi:regulatory protein
MTRRAPRSPVDRAVRRALRLLRARERTRAELLDRLLAAGFDRRDADAAIDRLGTLVDDARAAESHAHRLTARGPVARDRLRARLETLGVDPALARHAALRALPATDAQAARQAAEKAARRIPASLDPATRRRRVQAALARAGFDPDTAADALDHVLGTPPDEP